jgi:hypothetical protein
MLNLFFMNLENGRLSSLIQSLIKSLPYIANPLIIPITAKAINNSIIKTVTPQPLLFISPSSPTIVPYVLESTNPNDTIMYIKETKLTPKARAIGPFLGVFNSPNELVGV